MGSESGNSDEKPSHQVTLTKPYELGVYEMTQEQYEDAGLDPGGPASIPTVPEPGTWALLAVALLALLVAQRSGRL